MASLPYRITLSISSLLPEINLPFSTISSPSRAHRVRMYRPPSSSSFFQTAMIRYRTFHTGGGIRPLPHFPPHFVSFAWRYHGSVRFGSSLPPPPNAKRQAWGWSPGIPGREGFREDDRISQVPGEPPYPFAHMLGPRPDMTPLTIAGRLHGPRSQKDEGSDDQQTFEAQ